MEHFSEGSVQFSSDFRLDELGAAMRINLPVEQRIELARRQQAARAAARQERELQKLTKELEKNERQEAVRREREARSQQMMEVCPLMTYKRQVRRRLHLNCCRCFSRLQA